MKQGLFEITRNSKIAKDTYEMVLCGDTSDVTTPGQFINIRLDGFFLRRPISVCDCNPGTITVIYKTVGEGTEKMSRMENGERLDILSGLGNGYDTAKSGEFPLLIGGGVGVPPLFWLAKELVKEGKKPSVILGFNTRAEVFYEKEFDCAGGRVYIATADGSRGAKGFVTDVMKGLEGGYTYFYACGPEPMFRAVNDIAKTGGQFSFEERMGCGFGACMGCTCKTKYGSKRICREGPVMEREEIIW